MEHEVVRKAIPVPFHRLDQRLRRHPVERGEVRAQHHALAADEMDEALDAFRHDHGSPPDQSFGGRLPTHAAAPAAAAAANACIDSAGQATGEQERVAAAANAA